MDDFDFDSPALAGPSFIVQFNQNAQIHQLSAWGSSAGGESPFSLTLRSEQTAESWAEEYLPGSVLVSARFDPTDSWISGRLANVQSQFAEAEGTLDVRFEAEVSLLPEIKIVSHFAPESEPVPHLVWTLELTNGHRNSIEIGELALPMALANRIPQPSDPPGLSDQDVVRVYGVQAGAASFLHAMRLSREYPDFLILPGSNTTWSRIASEPRSLVATPNWQGIPIIYILGKATEEREGWESWPDGSGTLVMEPNETITVRTLFAPVHSSTESIELAMQRLGHPMLVARSGYVCPIGIPVRIDILGCTPNQILSDPEVNLESEAEDGGGSVTVESDSPGTVTLKVIDSEDRTSLAQILFTDPISQLIQRRSEFILKRQIPKSGIFHHAILPYDLETRAISDSEIDLGSGKALLNSLSDALFLAEKNTLQPREKEVAALDNYVRKFLLEKVVNPGSLLIYPGIDLTTWNRATGKPDLFLQLLLGTLLRRMGILAVTYGLSQPPQFYFAGAFAALSAPGTTDESLQWNPLASRFVPEVLNLAHDLDVLEMPSDITNAVQWIPAEVTNQAMQYGFATASLNLIPRTGSDRFEGPNLPLRSIAPNWYQFGGQPSWPFMNRYNLTDGWLTPLTSLEAKAELNRLSKSGTPLNSTEYAGVFGGLFSVWALVRSDGAAASYYVADPAHPTPGMARTSGLVGLSLFGYLDAIRAIFDTETGEAYGCTVEAKMETGLLTGTMNDGVGRQLEVRGLNVSVRSLVGTIKSFELPLNRSSLKLVIHNDSDRPRLIEAWIYGLWGSKLVYNRQTADSNRAGWYKVIAMAAAQETKTIQIKVEG